MLALVHHDDPDSTRKMSALRAPELAAIDADATSPFPLVDAKSLMAALPTPSESFSVVRLAPKRAARPSMREGIVLALVVLGIVALGVIAIAMGAQHLR